MVIPAILNVLERFCKMMDTVVTGAFKHNLNGYTLTQGFDKEVHETKIMNIAVFLSTIFSLFFMMGCNNNADTHSLKEKTPAVEMASSSDSTSVIYFAGGCFWGTEHFFKQVDGVVVTEVGFASSRFLYYSLWKF